MQQNNLKHQLMKQFILLILILMSGMIPTWAQTVVADDIEQLQNQALYFANHQQRNRGQLAAKDMQQYALDHDHKFGIYTGTCNK